MGLSHLFGFCSQMILILLACVPAFAPVGGVTHLPLDFELSHATCCDCRGWGRLALSAVSWTSVLKDEGHLEQSYPPAPPSPPASPDTWVG